ncbi:MAG: hypothetical protein F6K22_35735, partial [Okeania sp. SIO2F4]|uniref:hypothetical protein n=1 Tax=Okeania sp. SIO2F4 TaxID=2607790 RepID=UPI00142A6952
ENSTNHPHPAGASENELIIALYAIEENLTTHPHPACASENEFIIATYAWGRKNSLLIHIRRALQKMNF